jgi:hypothetical protein
MTRSQERYDAFAKAVDVPMLVITLLWLPVLIVPLVVPLHGSMAETFATIDYIVWALFALEYVIKFSLAPNRVTSSRLTCWTSSSLPSRSSDHYAWDDSCGSFAWLVWPL